MLRRSVSCTTTAAPATILTCLDVAWCFPNDSATEERELLQLAGVYDLLGEFNLEVGNFQQSAMEYGACSRVSIHGAMQRCARTVFHGAM